MNSSEKIRKLRLFTGCTTIKEFCLKHNFNYNTLQSLELGRTPLSTNNARKLARIFEEVIGLPCTPQWLLNDDHNTIEYILNNFASLDKITKETKLFKSLNENALVHIIKDDLMEPFLGIGDTVGGFPLTNKEIEQFKRGICIIKIENNYSVRFIQKIVGSNEFSINVLNNNSSTIITNLNPIKLNFLIPIKYVRKI